MVLKQKVKSLVADNKVLRDELGKLKLRLEISGSKPALAKLTLEQLPIGVLIWGSVSGEILKANLEMEKIIGLSAEQLVGQNYFNLYGSDKGWACYQDDNHLWLLNDLPSFRSSAQVKISRNVELLLRRRDGTELWVLVSTSPIKDEHGRIYAICSIMQNIDKHKRAEDKVRKNEERLNYALNASDEGLWDFDYFKDEGYLSPRYFKMLGYRDNAFSGTQASWVQLLHPDDRKKAVQSFRDVVEKRKDSYRSTYRLRTKSGDYRWILSRAVVVNRDENNKFVRVVGTHLDITEMRKMEEALLEANRKLEAQVRNKTEALNESLSLSKRMRAELTELNLLKTKGRNFVAHSPEMEQLLLTAIKLSRRNVSNILITGDSGTGKSRIAKFIHEISGGSNRPFVQINCAALPESLLEAELFGYEKGAFTGAKDEGKAGLFELAQGGTMFLDEIGEMPVTVQAKLLKCLDEKEIMHLGGVRPIRIECMVVAATNAVLHDLIEKKRFRRDLFFRLNTFPIKLPSLKERPEDILPLINHFLTRYNKQYGLNRKISSKGYKILQHYDFPGNVRELRNLVNKVVVLSEDDLLDEMIVHELQTAPRPDNNMQGVTDESEYDFEEQVALFEIRLLSDAIKKHKSTRMVASALNMSQSAVMRRVKKHGLSRLLEQQKK
ncbi:sigma 54-interacting transcriptional regulator [Desulforhopalus singaporensis]|nr:sigma 54-interacting transcriptional regulator [Desulforhopalus singaporensis]